MEIRMEIRPSNLFRRDRCPASGKLEGPNDGSTSPAAERGTNLHEIVKDGISKPDERVALMVKADDGLDFVNACWDEADSCWASLTPDQRKIAVVYIEESLDLKEFGLENPGTLDFAIVVPKSEIGPGFIYLRDWKSGYSYVPPARFNLQTKIYGSALVLKHAIEGDVSIGIVQPEAKENVDGHIFNSSELTGMPAKIKNIIARCQNDDAPAVAGSWCKYCRVKKTCEARLIIAAEIMKIADPIGAIKSLQGDEQTQAWEKLKDAIKILGEAHETIKEAVLSGELELYGYGTGNGKKSKYWTASNGETMNALLPAALSKGLAMPDIVTPIGVTKAEKLLGKEIVQGLYAEKLGKPSLKKVKAKKS